MIIHTLKEIVNGTRALMTHVCEGKVYYEIRVPNTYITSGDNTHVSIDSKNDSVYQLEINSLNDDWKTTYLMVSFKAIALMRWIRKGVESNDGTFIQLK